MNKKGKLSRQDVNDLCTLIEHMRLNISYGEGGTFGAYTDGDKEAERQSDKEQKATIRAINIIKQIILTNQ